MVLLYNLGFSNTYWLRYVYTLEDLKWDKTH